jgi:hypothetical protein
MRQGQGLEIFSLRARSHSFCNMKHAIRERLQRLKVPNFELNIHTMKCRGVMCKGWIEKLGI